MTQHEFQNRFIYNPTTDRLGKGGFGEVFKAYDTYRDRWVAVKMAKVETDQESVRLSKEVELVNKLPAHPNIAYYEECFTFSSFAGEYDFGILQYYEAGNLQQLIEKNNLTFAQKQSLLTQLLEGIGFLHEQGIIHRDLKPANILIVKRGDEYIPKITDFGISKKLDINNSSIFSNSLAGAGTLSFSSPEQLGSTTIRKNTDLWSFGVIAYWLLVGELPFNTGIHGTTSEAGRAELFSQIAKGALPQGIAAINQPWRKLIVACLETDSEKRVRNVDDCRNLLNLNFLNSDEKTKHNINSNVQEKYVSENTFVINKETKNHLNTNNSRGEIIKSNELIVKPKTYYHNSVIFMFFSILTIGGIFIDYLTPAINSNNNQTILYSILGIILCVLIDVLIILSLMYKKRSLEFVIKDDTLFVNEKLFMIKESNDFPINKFTKISLYVDRRMFVFVFEKKLIVEYENSSRKLLDLMGFSHQIHQHDIDRIVEFIVNYNPQITV